MVWSRLGLGFLLRTSVTDPLSCPCCYASNKLELLNTKQICSLASTTLEKVLVCLYMLHAVLWMFHCTLFHPVSFCLCHFADIGYDDIVARPQDCGSVDVAQLVIIVVCN